MNKYENGLARELLLYHEFSTVAQRFILKKKLQFSSISSRLFWTFGQCVNRSSWNASVEKTEKSCILRERRVTLTAAHSERD